MITLRSSIVVVPFLAFTLLSPFGTTVPGTQLADPIIVPFASAGCVTCEDCGNPYTHRTEGPVDNGVSGSPHPCEFGSDCSDHNSICGDFALTSEDLGKVRDAVVSDDPVAMKHVLAALQGQAEYVAARNAVQVLGCDGSVIAHFPLKSNVLRTLAE